jgi:hypothetical protein
LLANFWTKCPEKPAEAHTHDEQHGPARSPPQRRRTRESEAQRLKAE